MIPTYSDEIRKSFIDTYISYNLVALLINDETLGLTDAPNSTQLSARRALTMAYVISKEIGATSLKGYKRSVVTLGTTVNGDPNLSTNTAQATFQADPGQTLDTATHIVYVRGANLTGISTANGNNRGNIQGLVVLVEPLIAAPISLTFPTVFTHTANLRISTTP
jgi:hypothetical protein